MLENNENEIISDSDIERITGYKIASKQCEALKNAGIFFITRRDGKPCTTWGHFNYPVSLRQSQQIETGIQPNFGALD